MQRNSLHRTISASRLIACALLPAALFTAACSDRNATSPGPNATMPVPSIQITFADAHPLTTATQSEIYPDFTLTDPELVPEPLVFAYRRQEAADLRDPVILRRTNNAWHFVELSSLNHKDWVWAGASVERNELWAILDNTTELPDPGLFLFKSTDKGQTWKLYSGIRPPSRQAEFLSFSMDAKGNGKIVIHQDDDTDAARGQYTYTTSSGGAAWYGPTFVPDDLVSAEVPLTPTLQETLSTLDEGTSTTIPFEPQNPNQRRGRGPGFPGGRSPNPPFRRGG